MHHDGRDCSNHPVDGLAQNLATRYWCKLAIMSKSEPKLRPCPNSFAVPLSREEWERDFDLYVELGLAKPGETYEEYLRALSRDFIVCMPPPRGMSN